MIINKGNSTDFTEKMQRCQSYMEALEAERRKIQVFERELPLCLELVTQAIEGCKQQMSGTTTDYFNGGGQSECSEQTSSEAPVLEEFIPIKWNSSTTEQVEQRSRKDKIVGTSNQSNDVSNKGCEKFSKKSDWLRSAQLCIQSPDPTTTKKDSSPRKVAVVEVKKNGGGAFHPFEKLEKEKGCGTAVVSTRRPSPPGAPAAAASSTAETGVSSGGGGSKSQDKEGQSNRKSRRCWSPELHRRFLQSLQQLGGAHVATPKQIRELMKVDGLTNDEVKSHLQKYRLHTRRPSSTIRNSSNTQTPQFVVVGGLWMPPAEYTTTLATTTTTTSGDAATPTKGIYAPIASLPPSTGEASNKRQRSEDFHSDERGSGSDDRTRSNSPATSNSSTHTTTASPAF